MLKNTRRNLIYFIIITLISGWIGVLVDQFLTDQPEGDSLGMGIWLALPLLCAVIFRTREKEWKSFGLKLNLKTSWKGYVIAIFLYPVITIITILLALYFDCIDISMISWSAFLSAAAYSLVGTLIRYSVIDKKYI